MDCYCDYDLPEFMTQVERKARKCRTCDECGCTINPGETYESVAGKWDGVMSFFSTCERCLSFRKWFEANRPCVCWSFGNMLQDIRDQVDDEGYLYPDEAPGFLFEVGRRYVAIRNRARADRQARRAA